LKFLFVRSVLLLLFLAATSTSFALDELSSVTNVLKRMAEANRQLSYQGVFSYEHGGALKTVKVFHSVRDGHEFERIVHLNGPKREVIRRGNDLDCQRLGDSLLRGSSMLSSELGRGHIEKYYNLYLKGEERVAGREVSIIHVVPKDVYRYGYALGVDKETGLLLQSMLIGNNKRVLERFQFVDITIGALVDDMALEPTNSDHHLASMDAVPCVDDKGEFSSTESKQHWRTDWVPPGFAISGHQVSPETQRETLVFTDGLAVFSIFIDQGSVLDVPPMQAQRGATVAFLSRAEQRGKEYTICVVGEIPFETAKKVAHSLSALP
jgi:sigma-E factor negative regulatory protein RseB